MKQQMLEAEVQALRYELGSALNENQNLQIEIGKVRAALDNVQDRAPTIEEILSEEGFEKLSARFPEGLRQSGNPLNPTETAMSVVWSLVRYVDQVDEELARQDNYITELLNAEDEPADPDDMIERMAAVSMRVVRAEMALAQIKIAEVLGDD